MSHIRLDPEVVAECVAELLRQDEWQEMEEQEIVELILQAAARVHGK